MRLPQAPRRARAGRLVERTAKALCVALAPVALVPSAHAQSAASPNPWTLMATADLASIHRTLGEHYIYAVYPGAGMDWPAALAQADARAAHDLPSATTFAVYRALMEHFAGAFHDPHLRIRLNLAQKAVEWPGFLAAYTEGPTG